MSKFVSGVFRKIKKSFGAIMHHPVVSGVLVGSVLALGVMAGPFIKANNVNFNSARDCDSNAVLRCGAMSIGELTSKYQNSPGTPKIYEYFDISRQDISNIRKDVVAGKVNENGNVTVNGKLVATDAITAGRQNMPGSTKVTYKGVTFYKRKPSVSFQSNSLDSYVVMQIFNINFINQIFNIIICCSYVINC